MKRYKMSSKKRKPKERPRQRPQIPVIMMQCTQLSNKTLSDNSGSRVRRVTVRFNDQELARIERAVESDKNGFRNRSELIRAATRKLAMQKGGRL